MTRSDILITLIADDSFIKIWYDNRTQNGVRNKGPKGIDMRVYLVQHGQAKSKDVDPDRHLTRKGIDDVEKMSAFLKDAELQVDVIWRSGKTRAAQTAGILAKGVIAKGGVIQHDGLAPNDDIKLAKKELIKRDNDIMIVGHLPFLNKLASSLITDNESADVVSFQQGGVVCLEKDDDNVWSVRWMMVPELIP